MTFDTLVFQKGNDDGLDTKYYMVSGDEKILEDSLRFREGMGLVLIDRFNGLSTKVFDDLYNLTVKYEGPRDGFMRELARVLGYN